MGESSFLFIESLQHGKLRSPSSGDIRHELMLWKIQRLLSLYQFRLQPVGVGEYCHDRSAVFEQLVYTFVWFQSVVDRVVQDVPKAWDAGNRHVSASFHNVGAGICGKRDDIVNSCTILFQYVLQKYTYVFASVCLGHEYCSQAIRLQTPVRFNIVDG